MGVKITKRKDGRYMGRIAVGYDVEKKDVKYKSFYGKTEKEVDEKMTEYKYLTKKGTYTEPSKILLAEWMDIWLHQHKKGQIRTTTWEGYQVQVEKHIVPSLGHVKLCELQTDHIRNLYNIKKVSGRADGKEGGLSPNSIKQIHIALQAALQQAMDEGKIPKNPAKNVKLPKNDKDEVDCFNLEDVTKLLDTAKDTKYYPIYFLAVVTGMRLGELLGLRWKNIDFENGMVTISQGLVRTKDGLIFQKPKTRLSARTIGLPDDMLEVFKCHKEQQDEARKAAGEAWQDKMVFLTKKEEPNDLAFTNELGKPTCPRALTRHFERLLKRAEWEYPGFCVNRFFT
jgi:integrase